MVPQGVIATVLFQDWVFMQGPRQTGVSDVVQHHWLLGSGLLNRLHPSLQGGVGSGRGLVRHLQWGHDNRSVFWMFLWVGSGWSLVGGWLGSAWGVPGVLMAVSLGS